MSVAENEADRTSERIKFVMENKIAKGEAITGRVPIGYKIADKKFQIDPEKAEVVRALFRHYEEHHSPHDAVQYLYRTYGVNIPIQSAFWIMRNRIYIDYFKGNPNFCEPIISEAQFNCVQELMKSYGIRHNRSGQTYVFSGLLICGNCGRRFAGCRCKKVGNTFYRCYKCNAAYFRADFCTRRDRIREDWLEDWLLANIGAELESQRLESEAKARERKRNKPDRAAILRKMNRLKDLYVNEVIDLEQYKADYAQFTAQLEEADAAMVNAERTPDFRGIKEKVTGIENFYQDLNAEERQAFWRGLIREIRVDLDDSIHIFSSEFVLVTYTFL